MEGVKVYGSPWQPWFGGWAFNLERGPDIAAKWALIPDDTDVLLTHGPPAGTALALGVLLKVWARPGGAGKLAVHLSEGWAYLCNQ